MNRYTVLTTEEHMWLKERLVLLPKSVTMKQGKFACGQCGGDGEYFGSPGELYYWMRRHEHVEN